MALPLMRGPAKELLLSQARAPRSLGLALRAPMLSHAHARAALSSTTPQAAPATTEWETHRPVVGPADARASPEACLQHHTHSASQTSSPVHNSQMVESADLEQLFGPLSSAPMLPPPKPVVIVISGPSGVGKDAVVAKLKEARSDLYFVVTATSRPMRPMEVEGRDYFFVDRSKFEGWIQDDMLLEHANVYGDYKGIPRQQVDDALKAGTDVVLRIDVQGAATVKRLMPEAITIFVTAESEHSLVTRLAARKTEDLQKLTLRIRTAREEVSRAKEFDYIVENGTGQLDATVSRLSSIIDAEKTRTVRRYSQPGAAAGSKPPQA